MTRMKLAGLKRKSLGALTTKNLATLITPIAFVWAIGLAVLMTQTLVAGDSSRDDGAGAKAASEAAAPIRPVAEAWTQAGAIAMAKEHDLPAIAKADRVVIAQHFADEASADRASANGAFVDEARETTVKDKDALKRIREALVVKQVEPSGGETMYTLTFYRGDEVVREVWVYPYGEWGITRPKSASWTLGENEKLGEVLEGLVEGATG